MRCWADVRVLVALVPLLTGSSACGDDDDAVLQAETGVVYRFEGSEVPGDMDEAVRDRLAAFGIEPAIYRTTLHGIDGEPPFGTLELWLPPSTTNGQDEVVAFESLEHQGVLRFRPILSTTQGQGPVTAPRDDAANKAVDLPEQHSQISAIVATHHLGPTETIGELVESAVARKDDLGQWQIALVLRGDMMGRFNALVERCVVQAPECPTGQLAIVVDSRVLGAPVITQPAFERDQIVIGMGSDVPDEEVKGLASALNADPLPLALRRTGDIPPSG